MAAAKMLRVYFSEADRIDGKPAAEAIIELCRQAGLRGATVLRAIEGLGSHGLHAAGFLALSYDLPLVLEAVDVPERVDAAIELLRRRFAHHLIVSWPVEVVADGERE